MDYKVLTLRFDRGTHEKVLLMKRRVAIILILSYSSLAVAEKEDNTEAWYIEEEVNPLTDELELFIGIPNNEWVDNRLTEPKALWVRFVNGMLNVIVAWGSQLDDDGEIHYRFDKGAVYVEEWIMSTCRKTLFLPFSTSMEWFLFKMIQSDELIVGIKPAQKIQLTAVFCLKGFDKVIEPYLEVIGMEDLKDLDDEIIEFEDENLEQAVREAIGKMEGDLYLTDGEALEELEAWKRGIESLEGIQHLTSLERLDFGGNQVSDISALANLTSLRWLGFWDNEVSDISPLVANVGFGSGDEIYMRWYYLDLTPGSQNMEDINTLLGRGVVVSYD